MSTSDEEFGELASRTLWRAHENGWIDIYAAQRRCDIHAAALLQLVLDLRAGGHDLSSVHASDRHDYVERVGNFLRAVDRQCTTTSLSDMQPQGNA